MAPLKDINSYGFGNALWILSASASMQLKTFLDVYCNGMYIHIYEMLHKTQYCVLTTSIKCAINYESSIK